MQAQVAKKNREPPGTFRKIVCKGCEWSPLMPVWEAGRREIAIRMNSE